MAENNEFSPINTQDEFDRIISQRLKRERDTVSKGYEDSIAALRADLTARDERIHTLEESAKAHETDAKTIAELQSRVRGYEADSVKTRIALETGLPYGMASRLAGDTEEAIRKDAESLLKLMKPAAAPLATTVPTRQTDPKQAALEELAKQLGGN